MGEADRRRHRAGHLGWWSASPRVEPDASDLDHPEGHTHTMTVTIDLPEDALARLRAEATRRGVGIETVIAELAG